MTRTLASFSTHSKELGHTCQTLARGPNLARDVIIFGPQDHIKNVLEVARWPLCQYSACTVTTVSQGEREREKSWSLTSSGGWFYKQAVMSPRPPPHRSVAWPVSGEAKAASQRPEPQWHSISWSCRWSRDAGEKIGAARRAMGAPAAPRLLTRPAAGARSTCGERGWLGRSVSLISHKVI
ncbi:uncharacterized protein [Narcine bancroftii]|uniref:uncharacterized protein isoform X2 n=1 Tax=Narcine bancroftii TaxID=1343680 RepID=UPI0038320CC9